MVDGTAVSETDGDIVDCVAKDGSIVDCATVGEKDGDVVDGPTVGEKEAFGEKDGDVEDGAAVGEKEGDIEDGAAVGDRVSGGDGSADGGIVEAIVIGFEVVAVEGSFVLVVHLFASSTVP